MAAPLVSVVMPARDAAAHLREAIESILTQTFPDFEILLLDDGSTDGTAGIAGEYARADARVRVVRQERRGLITALNRGSAAARGRYLARMDADDVAFPERLTRQVACLERSPATAVLGTAMRYLGPSGPLPAVLAHPTGPEEIRRALEEYSCIAHPTVLMRRGAFEEAGGYRPAFLHAEDYDLWLRIAERHDLANLPEPLVYHRLHPHQVSFAQIPQQVISTLFARATAKMRRAGRPETAAGSGAATRQALLDLGMTGKALDEAIVAAYVFRANLLLGLGCDDQVLIIAEEIARLPIEPPVRGRLGAEAAWIRAKVEIRRKRFVRGLGWILRACAGRPS
ncbi:MAG TPA: glycosyltransferase, partial [Candidatus Polarisedimenticolia bacterium]|nr:glycosyltransferase [Candidatus Polarisedimenticolia bacterium]